MEPTSKRHSPVDEANTVIATALCIKCGTDLRGHSIEARCPTCRHPIYDSVYGGYLIDASPLEPRRLLDMSNIVLFPAVFLGGLTVIMVLATLASSRKFADAVYHVFDTLMFCALLSPLVALVGTVVFTGRRTAAFYRAKYGNPRAIGLVVAALVVTIVAVGVAITYLGHYAEAVVRVLIIAVPAGAFLRALGGLMRRVPNKKLAALAGLAFAALCTLAIAALAILILRPYAFGRPDLDGFITALTLITSCGGLGLGYGVIRLLVLARRTLRAIYH